MTNNDDGDQLMCATFCNDVKEKGFELLFILFPIDLQPRDWLQIARGRRGRISDAQRAILPRLQSDVPPNGGAPPKEKLPIWQIAIRWNGTFSPVRHALPWSPGPEDPLSPPPGRNASVTTEIRSLVATLVRTISVWLSCSTVSSFQQTVNG